MMSKKIAWLIAAAVTLAAPAAFAGGSGGTDESAAGTGGSAIGATTYGSTATQPSAITDGSVTTGMGRGAAQSSEKGDAATGLNPDGSIGQTGRVGTALDGRPIGFPGTGLGSRGDSLGPPLNEPETR